MTFLHVDKKDCGRQQQRCQLATKPSVTFSVPGFAHARKFSRSSQTSLKGPPDYAGSWGRSSQGKQGEKADMHPQRVEDNRQAEQHYGRSQKSNEALPIEDFNAEGAGNLYSIKLVKTQQGPVSPNLLQKRAFSVGLQMKMDCIRICSSGPSLRFSLLPAWHDIGSHKCLNCFLLGDISDAAVYAGLSSNCMHMTIM